MAIIIEDDMHLMNNFYTELQKEIEKYNKEFDILNFGYLKKFFSDIDNSKFYFGAGCYIVTKEACEIMCKHVFPIDTHVDAYFFLLNHFGYIKMIMSDKDIIFHGGDFNTNISHGVLKCSDKNNNNYVNLQNSSTDLTSSTNLNQANTALESNQFNFILCVLLLLIIIIISIKLYIINNMKNN
jgi:hypothetical protein